MSTWQELRDNPRLKKIYTERMTITRCVREFFWGLDFMEVSTPLALRFPGQEPYLNPVPIIFHDPADASYNFWLHTSPEYSLKKLLAAGYPKIFEITKTFRDGEALRGTHSPEFTMIEWYRAPGELAKIMDDTEGLMKYVAKKVGIESFMLHYTRCMIQVSWERLSMKELWQRMIGVNLDDNLEINQIRQTAIKRGYEIGNTDAYEDVFFKIFLNEIEPHLGLERPIFVYDYPAQMCSLSRLSADPRYAERAELYIMGLEIANGFGELLDPVEQKRRLESDRALRAKLSKPIWPVDPNFIAALAGGISSPTSGIALGLDRMVLLFTGAKDINEVIFNSAADQLM